MKAISFVTACILALGLCFLWAQVDATNEAYRLEQRK